MSAKKVFLFQLLCFCFLGIISCVGYIAFNLSVLKGETIGTSFEADPILIEFINLDLSKVFSKTQFEKNVLEMKKAFGIVNLPKIQLDLIKSIASTNINLEVHDQTELGSSKSVRLFNYAKFTENCKAIQSYILTIIYNPAIEFTHTITSRLILVFGNLKQRIQPMLSINNIPIFQNKSKLTSSVQNEVVSNSEYELIDNPVVNIPSLVKVENLIPLDNSKTFKTATTDRTDYLKYDRLNIEGRVVKTEDKSNESVMYRGFWDYYAYDNQDLIHTRLYFGHRILNFPPEKETFYSLDKAMLGDQIEVARDGVVYFYEVINTDIISENDVDKLTQESFESIKLITCTPIGTSLNRIVITAKRI